MLITRHLRFSLPYRAVFSETLRPDTLNRLLDPAIDPEQVADEVVRRYESLWHELTYSEYVPRDERHRLEARVRPLNELGFDVAEAALDSVGDGFTVRPKVVDAGHHARRLARLARLTGLLTQENQARRLLNDLDRYRAEHGVDDEEGAATRWLTQIFEPVVRAVPPELREKLEPPEVFHQLLDHRWFLPEAAGEDVGFTGALPSYLADVLPHKPDERAVLPREEP